MDQLEMTIKKYLKDIFHYRSIMVYIKVLEIIRKAESYYQSQKKLILEQFDITFNNKKNENLNIDQAIWQMLLAKHLKFQPKIQGNSDQFIL